MIISIHIPKTAGLTFLNLLTQVYGAKLVTDYEDKPDAFNFKLKKFNLNPFNPFDRLIYRYLHSKSCIHGHFLLAKYKYVPNAKFIAWVRDPVQRVMSHYYHWQRVYDPLNATCVYLYENKLSLLEFARLEPMRNLQKYYLSDKPVNKMKFIGVTEYFKESIQSFNTIFSLDLPYDLKLNINPEPYEVEASILDKIRDLNLEDMKLYEAVLRKYNYSQTI